MHIKHEDRPTTFDQLHTCTFFIPASTVKAAAGLLELDPTTDKFFPGLDLVWSSVAMLVSQLLGLDNLV